MSTIEKTEHRYSRRRFLDALGAGAAGAVAAGTLGTRRPTMKSLSRVPLLLLVVALVVATALLAAQGLLPRPLPVAPLLLAATP